jgi:hypothetical protein
MKIAQPMTLFGHAEFKTIAIFGRARLVKTPNGKYQLQGGSRNDRIEAREWVSLFMHEVFI